MAPPDSTDLSAAIVGTLVILVIFACAAVWATMAVRWCRRRPVLAYQPRRPVPWRIGDVALLVMAYFVAILAPGLVLHASRSWFGFPAAAAPQAAKAAPLDAEHPLARVLLESHNGWAILLCAVSAVVIAPITEELIFRLLLQGWLESLERRVRRQIPWLRRIVMGIMPVMTVALLFAAVHFRSPGPRADLPLVVFLLGAYSVASVLMVAVSVCWLRCAVGATLADFGIVPSKLVGDLRTAALAFLAVTVPVYAVMFDVSRLLPESVVADPIPIFFLAIALGTLYYRTHRIVPSIALHMAFNAAGLLMALGASR